MEALIYIGKVSLYWIAFYCCYWLFLRRTTFFVWNRVHLIGALVGAFFLPFLSYPSSAPVMATAVYAVSVIPVTVSGNLPKAESGMMDWQSIIWLVYASGVVFMAIRLYKNIRELLHYIKQSEMMEMDGFKLVLLPPSKDNESISSFSFLNWVVLTQEDYESHLDEIMRHELVHVTQRHSYDILLIEVLQVFFWFNPILIFYKSSLQQIHEYLADQETSDKDEYAKFLLSYTMGVPAVLLANHFFKPSLIKERIIMLYRERNSRWLLGRYMIIIPLVVTVLMVTAARQRILEAVEAKRFVDKDFYESILTDTRNKVALKESMGTVTDTEGNGLGIEPIQEDEVIGYPSREASPNGKDNGTEEKVYTLVEENPEFPGGISGMYKFLGNNLRYPSEAVEKRIEGKVFLSFIVNEQGYIRDVKVLKGLGYGTDEEAVRVMLSMPKWKPARHSGKAVALRYNVPISFVLNKAADGANQERKDASTTLSATPVYPKESTNKSGKFSIWHKDGAEKDMLGTFVGSQANTPLVIADGERYQGEVSSSALKSYMREKAIMKVTVLKGHEAIEKYGEEGTNGVLIMETKIK